MRHIPLVLLMSCVVVTDEPPTFDPCAPSTVCYGANLISQEYCSRRESCFGLYDPFCVTDMVDVICSSYDCQAFYSNASRQRLLSCLDYRDSLPCWGPEPPPCHLF